MNVRRTEAGDLDAVYALVRACDEADVGAADTTRDDLLADWADTSFEGWLAELDGRDAGYAGLWERAPERAYADGFVHPDLRGRGVGTHLVRLVEERARARGFELLSSFALASAPGAGSLHRAAGFTLTRHLIRMEVELDAAPPPPALPAGVELGTLEPADERALHAALEEAFADEYGFQAEPFERWRERTLGRPDFDPELVLLARDDGAIAGFVIGFPTDDDGWIAELGVRPATRRRGLGLALLHASFGAFWSRGVRRVSLYVDAENPTDARRLYERAGMREAFRMERWEKRLATL